MCWSLYSRDFEFQVGEMSSKNKIGEKKANTLIYNKIENQLIKNNHKIWAYKFQIYHKIPCTKNSKSCKNL